MSSTASGPTKNRRAVIDVGSNSVKMLIADVVDGVVMPLVHDGEQTRLGRGVFKTGCLQSEAIADTASVVAAFASNAREQCASEVRILATSAARDAANGDELTAAIAAAGLTLEIITGQTEAELVLCGVRSYADFQNSPLAVIDVGGGSTELLVADGNQMLAQHSFNIGTVRWLEKFPLNDPPTQKNRQAIIQALDEFFDEQITPALADVPLPSTLVGAGGTPVFLARIQAGRDDLTPDELEATTLTLSEIQSLSNRLWSLPLACRCQLPGLPPNRADVILLGTAIYEALMLRCAFAKLRPTLRGVRYGALLQG